MLVETLRTPYKKARLVNYTTNGYPTFIAGQATVPTLTDVSSATAQVGIELSQPNGGASQNAVQVLPFGVGADDATFSMRIIGWQKSIGLVGKEVLDTELWVPLVLVEVLCTLSTFVGVAGRYVLDTERLVDIITLVGTTGNAGVDVDIVSPGNNTPGRLLVDLLGSSVLEVQFTTGGSATSCNALLGYL